MRAPVQPATGAGAGAGSLELALAQVLQLGTYASIGLILLGSALLISSGGSPLAGGPPLSLATLPGDIISLRPAGFLWLGIIGVLATPGLRVLRALSGFGRRGEPAMAAVALLILLVIGLGVFVGVVSG